MNHVFKSKISQLEVDSSEKDEEIVENLQLV